MARSPHPNTRPARDLPPELRRVSVPPAARAWVASAAREPVVSVQRLAGASSTAVHRLVTTSGASLVVRRYLWPGFLADEPIAPRREANALAFACSRGLPVPELAAVDLDGSEIGDGVPTLLMTYLPGWPVAAPDPMALAELLAAIHATDATGLGHDYFRWFADIELSPPRKATNARLWSRAFDVWSAEMSDFKPVLIHRDFHPGNVLWRRGRASGVVDWANACRGPIGCDVAHCRNDLIRTTGFDAADAFETAYRELTGFDLDPYWEIASVIDHGPSPWTSRQISDAERRLGRAMAELGVSVGKGATSPARPPGRPSSDRSLSPLVVASAVADQFEQIPARHVRLLGSGWDHDVYLVDRTWVFRFPRRAEQVPWLEREIALMTKISPVLGPLAPRFRWQGAPNAVFPYPFVGYRRLPGGGADESRRIDHAGLARDLGVAIGRLHGIDTASTAPTPAGWESQSWQDNNTKLVAVADVVRSRLPAGLLKQARPYLEGEVPAPPTDGPLRFIHNDICPDHVLIDRHSGRLSGLIDFSDSMVGDPVLDFVGLIGIGDRRFIEAVVDNYAHPVGDNFWAKLVWLTRVLSLRWLADATVDSPDKVDRHLTWVERAFDA